MISSPSEPNIPRVSEDLDSDLYYNQEEGEEEEEEEVETSSASSKGEAYKNLLSEFDDFVANEKNGALIGTSRALSFGFEVGDMVWGKVKSHPWWPGHIFNESLATSSVRRTRREGHVLVAFFGDSSYGWFDPAELIPFEANYKEKSRQTSSRNFVKAVDEAVDEAARRSGLGLACRCRNKFNFRATSVEGYFAVDVPDYEPGGVYSEKQIWKARDEFRPYGALDFVRELAAAPGQCDVDDINFVKFRAVACAFRKAVFEEFDETYAEAFGVSPSRSSKGSSSSLDGPAKEPTRAPLSGPLVIAETLGGGKSSKKAMKVMEQSKKDKYVFKRRDDPSDGNVSQVAHKEEVSSTPAAYSDGLSTSGGDHLLQKRDATSFIRPSDYLTGSSGRERIVISKDEHLKVETLDQAANRGATLDAKQPVGGEKLPLQELKQKAETESSSDMGPMSIYSSDGKELLLDVTDVRSVPAQQVGEAATDLGSEETSKASRSNEDVQEAYLIDSTGAENSVPGLNLLLDSKHSVERNVGGIKKIKKQPLGDSGSEKISIREKKRKKELGAMTSSDYPKKSLAAGKAGKMMGGSIMKPLQSGLVSKEGTGVAHTKKDVTSNDSSLQNVGASLPLVSTANFELDVPKLLRDLHAIAIEPRHVLQRSNPFRTVQFFLRFRSLVYQKSLALSPPSEIEQVELHSTKPSSHVGISDKPAAMKDRELAPSKPEKSLGRTDDPTKAGRKRLPSERQEEIVAKKLKKMQQLKSLAEEKKAGQKSLEPPRAEPKLPVAVAPPQRPVKPDSLKSQPKAIEPTMLVMKFPPETSLPSGAELKAKFARFGSIDQSAIRVFWKSSTCRVVFRHKRDAQAALRYANANSTLFGNVIVRYSIREVGAPEVPESEKVRGDNPLDEATRSKDSLVERAVSAFGHQPLPQSAQPKSILKKPSGDEAGQITGSNAGRGSRVKFMLGGEESTNRGEQLMVGNRNNFNTSTSFADGGAPTSVAMDFNSKKVISLPSSLPPLLPLPSEFAKSHVINPHHCTEVAHRNMNSISTQSAAPIMPTIDISQQMLSLLTRCNDVVTSVTGMLGYVPYHPL